MIPFIRIVGQGLAGTILAWELARKGLPFEVVERAAPSPSASHVGAGIINPVTGQRLVKSWRVDEYLPRALHLYREIEDAFGTRLVTRFVVRRLFTSEHERAVAEKKIRAGDLLPYVREMDTDGCWIEGAARVDTGRVVDLLREHWQNRGVYREEGKEGPRENRPVVTVRALGFAEIELPEFRFAGLRPAKGEIIDIHTPPLDPGVLLNRGHWVLPVTSSSAGATARQARVGATVERGTMDPATTPHARELLLSFARELLGPEVHVCRQVAGIRTTTPDRHPVIGWSSPDRTLGIMNGLGSKAALLAPQLASAWAEHLAHGQPFDPALDVGRFRR